MRYSTILRDEDAVRELIFQLALDLRDAEKDGLTAKEFFGDNPKKMVDDLVKNSKVSSKLSIVKLFTFSSQLFVMDIFRRLFIKRHCFI